MANYLMNICPNYAGNILTFVYLSAGIIPTAIVSRIYFKEVKDILYIWGMCTVCLVFSSFFTFALNYSG